MVSEVTAWQDSHGQLHDNKRQALLADALFIIGGIEGLNEAFARVIIEHAEQISDVLIPLRIAKEA